MLLLLCGTASALTGSSHAVEALWKSPSGRIARKTCPTVSLGRINDSRDCCEIVNLHTICGLLRQDQGPSAARSAHRQTVNFQRGNTYSHRDGLPIFAAGADTLIEL